MSALLAALLLLFAPLQDVTACAVATEVDGPLIVHVAADADTPAAGTTTRTFTIATTDEPATVTSARTFSITTSDGPTVVRSNVWIGVRVTPIPAPLAAHIGNHGVLIANIVCDSPADAAGLERYDVLVRFGDHDIDAPSDLTVAVGAVKPGTPVEVGVIRGGQVQELRLQPAPRPQDAHYTLKYDEPEEQFLDRTIELRGKTLQVNPNGQWIISDLGALDDLPDILAKVPFSGQFFGDPNDLDIDIQMFQAFDPNNPPLIWHATPDDQRDITMQVQVNTDGTSLIVRRASSGAIHVTRTGPDGISSESEYADMAELDAADPEAATLLESQVQTQAFASPRVRRMKPHGPEMDLRRKQFQEEVERRLQEAIGRSESARQRIRRWQDAPETTASAHNDQQLLGARGYPDGRIRVFVRDAGGDVEQFEFVDEAAFQTAEPELYQRYHELFGD